MIFLKRSFALISIKVCLISAVFAIPGASPPTHLRSRHCQGSPSVSQSGTWGVWLHPGERRSGCREEAHEKAFGAPGLQAQTFHSSSPLRQVTDRKRQLICKTLSSPAAPYPFPPLWVIALPQSPPPPAPAYKGKMPFILVSSLHLYVKSIPGRDSEAGPRADEGLWDLLSVFSCEIEAWTEQSR